MGQIRITKDGMFNINDALTSLVDINGSTGRLNFTTVRQRLIALFNEPWRTVGAIGQPPFLNGWQADSFSPLQFRKTLDGSVLIRGWADGSNAVENYIFILPNGYIPPNDMFFFSTSNGEPRSIVIDGSGEGLVSVNDSNSIERKFILDGISFYPANS